MPAETTPTDSPTLDVAPRVEGRMSRRRLLAIAGAVLVEAGCAPFELAADLAKRASGSSAEPSHEATDPAPSTSATSPRLLNDPEKERQLRRISDYLTGVIFDRVGYRNQGLFLPVRLPNEVIHVVLTTLHTFRTAPQLPGTPFDDITFRETDIASLAEVDRLGLAALKAGRKPRDTITIGARQWMRTGRYIDCAFSVRLAELCGFKNFRDSLARIHPALKNAVEVPRPGKRILVPAATLLEDGGRADFHPFVGTIMPDDQIFQIGRRTQSEAYRGYHLTDLGTDILRGRSSAPVFDHDTLDLVGIMVQGGGRAVLLDIQTIEMAVQSQLPAVIGGVSANRCRTR